jgi:hypothetical protein
VPRHDRRRRIVTTVPRLLARFTQQAPEPSPPRARARSPRPAEAPEPSRRPPSAAEQLAEALADPSGRRARRGIPLAGNGGLDCRRDPALEVEARDEQRHRRRAALELARLAELEEPEQLERLADELGHELLEDLEQTDQP